MRNRRCQDGGCQWLIFLRNSASRCEIVVPPSKSPFPRLAPQGTLDAQSVPTARLYGTNAETVQYGVRRRGLCGIKYGIDLYRKAVKQHGGRL